MFLGRQVKGSEKKDLGKYGIMLQMDLDLHFKKVQILQKMCNNILVME